MNTATNATPTRHKATTRVHASARGHTLRVPTKERRHDAPSEPNTPAVLALEVVQPNPHTLYSLDATARLAGASRHSLLVYCRVGLVQPVLQPPHDAMAFTGETIQAVRRIQHVRLAYGIDVPWIKTILCLLEEVERLRSEVRYLRDQ